MPREEEHGSGFDSKEPDPTAEHMARAAQGSTESLEWLIGTFSPGILATAHRRHRPSLEGFGDPEDVVQDTWLRTIPHLGTIRVRPERASKDLLHYLGTCVSNHYCSLARRLSHSSLDGNLGEEASSSWADQVALETATGIVTKVARSEMNVRLEEALDQLDELDRNVLILRGLQQLSNSDVAMLLQINESSVSSRYRRALERIRVKVPGSLFDLL